MKKEEAINTFNQGMIMDINPIVTPNDSLCNALNATLVTFNGNENVLQCDMGNGRVETACLPPGYVPVGSTQLGGIIYIVSYNPIINKSQIGCFPSPERNITTDELQAPNNNLIISDLFGGNSSHIKSKLKKLILLDKEIHPGDKFQIGCNQLQYQEDNFISAQEPGNTNPDKYPKYIKLNVVAIQDNGIINNLNNSLIWHDNNYYILGTDLKESDGKLDLGEYRNLIQSNYNVFDSKVDGKLAILAELECIDTFSVSWDAVKNGSNWDFYFYLNWTYNNQVSADKINLYGIGIQANGSAISDKIITTYPKSIYGTNNDILSNKETIFYTPCYVNSINDPEIYSTNNNIISPRKNDGTDNQFLLMSPYSISQTSGTVNFDIYPKMPFGYLDWLKQSFSVDISSLGSGKIELKEYRYYYNEGNIIINWGLDAYPERNKEIKSVEFQFYDYDENVKSYIQNNSSNIQNNYSVNNTWNESSSDNFNLTTTRVHTISGKSSYSGHFQEQIKILEDNKLYLVRIVINYNDEKTICYYRLMYTCDIFNDFYFDYNDYKEIYLQDAIKNTITYQPDSKSITRVQITDQCLDSEGNPVTTFAEYEDNATSKSYKIVRIYECNMDFNIKGNSGFPGIEINIDSIEQNGQITDSFSPESPRKTSISSDQIKSDTSSIDNINKTITHDITLIGSQYSDKYSQKLEIPIQVDYNMLSDLNVSYQFEPLDVACGWLLVDGGSRQVSLYVTGTYVRSDSGMGNTNFGDDSHNYGMLSKYKDTYDELKNRMQNCDILALRFRVHHEAKAGDQGNWSIWGQGSWHGGDRAKFDFNIYYDTNEIANSGNLILYLFTDSNGDLQLTTFGKNYSWSSPGTWYGQRVIVPIKSSDLDWPKVVKPFALPHNVSDDVLIKPFSKYFKVEESSITIQKYRWNKVHYYENFTWTNTINVPLSISMSLQVNNGITLESIDSIPNLYYTNSRSYTLQANISNSESFDNWIDKILYIATNNSLVALPEENGSREIKSLQVSPKSIYDKYGNKIDYLKEDIGVDTELSQLTNSKHKLQCIDGRIQLKKGVPNSKNVVNIMGREEEQNIAISNIIQINE